MSDTIGEEFGRFWEQTCEKVKAYLFCACNNRHDADDLAQECYLRALRNWGYYNGQGTRQAWLFAIARNTQIDWLRKRIRDRRLAERHSERPASEAEPASGPQFDDIEMIWQAVGHLATEYKEVVYLRFAAELSYAEIAELLGVPIGTVRSRLHRGLKALRAHIKETGKCNVKS